MPVTPFHFGPAAAIKAVIPRYFSFTVFCFAQVATDTEVLYHMVHGDAILHQFFHTYLGATFVGLFSCVAGRWAGQFFLRKWRNTPDLPLKEYFNPSPNISWPSAAIGAFLGTYSHVFLDSIMHRDMRPFYPFSTNNPMLGLIGLGSLHEICFILGVGGGLACAGFRRNQL